jgi:hypothetical protein
MDKIRLALIGEDLEQVRRGRPGQTNDLHDRGDKGGQEGKRKDLHQLTRKHVERKPPAERLYVDNRHETPRQDEPERQRDCRRRGGEEQDSHELELGQAPPCDANRPHGRKLRETKAVVTAT